MKAIRSLTYPPSYLHLSSAACSGASRERPEDRARLRERLLPLPLGVGREDDASSRVHERSVSVEEHGPDQDRQIECTVPADPAERSRVDAAAARLELVHD